MSSLETTMSVDSHTTHSTRSFSPSPNCPTVPGTATWEEDDSFPPPPDAIPPPGAFDEPEALPQYERVDPERMRRKSISQALWEEHRQREAEMARRLDADRLERQRSREAQRRGSGVFDRWVRWSAKFYMPLMSQWGDQHTHR